MTNYRMKQLQNIVANKQRIISNTRKKIAEPKKKTINWTYLSTSMAVIVLCIFFANLSWDTIGNPIDINQTNMFVEQSEVELIVIDNVETNETITIDNKETIEFIADWLNEVFSKPHHKVENEQAIIYQMYIKNTGYYPAGAISLTSEKLIIGENYYEISTQQYETITNLLVEVMDRENGSGFDVTSFEARVERHYDIANANSHSGWKTSPAGLQQATIDGKGENASEEGEALLIIENLETKDSTIYKLKDNSVAQNTPKYVEWIDENRLFVIVGFAHGTVTKGGQLYEMNIEDNTVIPVFEDLTIKEEIMTIKANDNGTFTYQKHIYLDDNATEGRIEEGILPFPSAK